MNLLYKYKKTPQIEKLLTRIEIARALIDHLPKLPRFEENLKRKSLLKSSLFSARIEGNILTYEEVENVKNIKPSDKTKKEKKEVFNILSALQFAKTYRGMITKDTILRIHKKVTEGLAEGAGSFRTEPSVIFNEAGIAIYLTPPPNQLEKLLDKFLKFINNSTFDPVPIRVAVGHFMFEKIHPFLDGNGRVGRILTSMHLTLGDYGFRGLIAYEEYIELNKESYYYSLSQEGKDITGFVTFFLEAIAESAEKIIEQIKNKKEEAEEDFLLPRRSEILAIIKDHKVISFDQIRRRFLKVNPRTLHYDLQNLIKNGFVNKLGNTKGAFYAHKN